VLGPDGAEDHVGIGSDVGLAWLLKVWWLQISRPPALTAGGPALALRFYTLSRLLQATSSLPQPLLPLSASGDVHFGRAPLMLLASFFSIFGSLGDFRISFGCSQEAACDG